MTTTTVDIYSATSWKKGVFTFRGKPLKEIMGALSRWYDMDVVFENKELETVKFKGVFRKNQSIEEILSAIKSVSINNYEINDRTITLK